MTRVVRAGLVAAAIAFAAVLVVVPRAAGGSCTGPMGPGERCEDTVGGRSTNGWVLIPLGLAIGGLVAAVYLAVEHRSRGRQASRS